MEKITKWHVETMETYRRMGFESFTIFHEGRTVLAHIDSMPVSIGVSGRLEVKASCEIIEGSVRNVAPVLNITVKDVDDDITCAVGIGHSRFQIRDDLEKAVGDIVKERFAELYLDEIT